MGFLCLHALRVMSVKNITRIPDKYVLTRWTKVARKMRCFEFEQGNSSHVGGNETETIFRIGLVKYAYNLVMKSQGNEIARELCRNALIKVDAEVERELAKLDLGGKIDMSNNKANVNQYETITDVNFVLDPTPIKPKGISNARLKGHFGKHTKK